MLKQKNKKFQLWTERFLNSPPQQAAPAATGDWIFPLIALCKAWLAAATVEELLRRALVDGLTGDHSGGGKPPSERLKLKGPLMYMHARIRRAFLFIDILLLRCKYLRTII